MPIPFLSYFKRGKDESTTATKAPAAPPPSPPREKPSSERFSKTVMPNATRKIASEDPFDVGTRRGTSTGKTPPVPAPNASAPRTVSFNPTASTGGARDLPPAVALALELKMERALSLALSDIIPQLPTGYLKPLDETESARRVLLKASEVEKGMAAGRPTVSIESIYQQMPEIFLRSVPAGDPAQVRLPFSKVLEQFSRLQVRGDQVQERAVPQVETPFLKVTLEDSAKFGTPLPMQPAEAAELPPVRVEPATAKTIAAAEPEPATQAKYTPPAEPEPSVDPSIDTAYEMPLPRVAVPEPVPGSEAPTAPKPPAPAPARIPFKLTPNGAGASAPEPVPASSGPPAPTSVPPSAAPMRIPFKITAPSDDLRPKMPAAPVFSSSPVQAASTATPAPGPQEPGTRISLSLRAVLQGLPAFQLNGDAASVPPEVRIDLPFGLIQPQLASGRVMISPQVLAAALPAAQHGLFNASGAATDVALPLQEVLKNVPTTSLQMRPDQVQQEIGEQFVTPFSATAAEDAKRFNLPPTPITKTDGEQTSPAPLEEAAPAEPEEPAGSAKRTALQEALDTDEDLDAKAIVAQVDQFPGVKASAILFGDGLQLAGNLPPELEAEGLCAMAPSLLQKIENHMSQTKLGALRAMTLACAKSTVTFFMHENLCLAALHADDELAPAVRERLNTVVHELARKYSQTA